jgi:V/A-type H+-transporting ATPase subunit I
LDLPPTAALFILSRYPKTFFFVSLGFGAVQLSVGILARLVRQLHQSHWQGALSTMGWLLVIPGLLAWAMADTPWVFVMALALVLVFASTSTSLLRRLGSGAWAVYNISGLAGDVMSYVRIFGLGLSSGILAMVINTLALLLVDIPWVGWPLCVVFLILGHTFNFVLAMVGAVVHSARLQFLEFLGKFFEGGGRPYLPFAKLEGE